MKKIFITIAFSFISLIINAQSKDITQSNAEIFSEKPGALIQKEIVDIGIIKKCKIQVVHFTDLISTTGISAIKFEYELTSANSIDSKSTYIDTDEIEGLLKSLKIIQEKINSLKPANYTEIYFRSRGGLETGCITGNGGWTTYLIIQKIDDDRYIWITIADLKTLYTLLEQAKDKL